MEQSKFVWSLVVDASPADFFNVHFPPTVDGLKAAKQMADKWTTVRGGPATKAIIGLIAQRERGRDWTAHDSNFRKQRWFQMFAKEPIPERFIWMWRDVMWPDETFEGRPEHPYDTMDVMP